VGGAHNTCGSDEKYLQNFVRKCKHKETMGDAGISKPHSRTGNEGLERE
jgi:hypothetical protein